MTPRALVLGALMAAGFWCLAVYAADVSEKRSITFRSRTMGTYGDLILVTEDSLAAVPYALTVEDAFNRVDSLMSNWSTTSEVARINRLAAEETLEVHPEVARVIETALRVERESEGCFDITVEPLIRTWGFLGGKPAVPEAGAIDRVLPLVGVEHLQFDADTRRIAFARPGVRIDLGGIAKGYGVDVAVASLRERGVANALINLSGNMTAMGAPPARQHWVIGVRDPRDRIPYVARLSVSDKSIATSGKYEQFVTKDGRTYGHIIDPRTGWPSDGLLAVTVIAPTATEADAWGTALFVLGPPEARRLAKEREDLEVLLIQPGRKKDVLWVEEQLRDAFELEEAAKQFLSVTYF